MLAEMSSRQIAEWMAFFQLEPFGYDADMLGHGIVASTIANVFRSKNQKPFSPADFMPKRVSNTADPYRMFKTLKEYFTWLHLQKL